MEIVVNGQPYAEWSGIPEEHRPRLSSSQTDSDGSGVPDVFEGEGKVDVTIDGNNVSISAARSVRTSTSSTAVSVGGYDVTGWFKRLFKR